VRSLDTGTCAESARQFGAEAAWLPNAAVLTVSRDFPFEQKYCDDAVGLCLCRQPNSVFCCLRTSRP
jgi:peroxiredoxin